MLNVVTAWFLMACWDSWPDFFANRGESQLDKLNTSSASKGKQCCFLLQKYIHTHTKTRVCIYIYIDTLIYIYVYNILLDECFFMLHLRLTLLFWEKSNRFPCQRAATQPVHSVWERQVSHLRCVIFQLHSIPFIICFKNTVCRARKNRSCRGKEKIN